MDHPEPAARSELFPGAVLLTRRWRMLLDAEVSRYGLTTATCRPLFYLGELGDGVRPKDLAEALDLERPSLGQLVDRLEAQGFILRRDDPEDRRGKTLHLTEKGREIYLTTVQVVAAVRSRLLEGVSDEDLATCLRVFRQIAENGHFEDGAIRTGASKAASAR
jgi:MarR family transcriptional regulator for hemolysin